MKVKQLYDSPTLPYHYIAELEDGSFVMFSVCGGFRKITEKDLLPVYYKPQPAHAKVDKWLYALYGLEKTTT